MYLPHLTYSTQQRSDIADWQEGGRQHSPGFPRHPSAQLVRGLPESGWEISITLTGGSAQRQHSPVYLSCLPHSVQQHFNCADWQAEIRLEFPSSSSLFSLNCPDVWELSLHSPPAPLAQSQCPMACLFFPVHMTQQWSATADWQVEDIPVHNESQQNNFMSNRHETSCRDQQLPADSQRGRL